LDPQNDLDQIAENDLKDEEDDSRDQEESGEKDQETLDEQKSHGIDHPHPDPPPSRGREISFETHSPSPCGKEAAIKIQSREGKASLVVRGRGKFRPPKPGGRCMTVKHFPDFRGATPATWEYFNKSRRIFSPAPVS